MRKLKKLSPSTSWPKIKYPVVVLNNSSLYDKLSKGRLNIPGAKPLKGQIFATTFYLIGDDIFSLNRNVKKAYSQSSDLNISAKVVDYRLSRARMTVEMAFGKLANVSTFFTWCIEVSIETYDKILKVCCLFHNYNTWQKKKIFLNFWLIFLVSSNH